MSDRLDRLINNSAMDHSGEGSNMFLSTAILNHEQKDLLKKALFFYQKDACENNGDVSDEDRGLIESIIDINSEIEVLADSISLPEGPLWDESSKSLLFVDVMGNKMYKWNESDGVSEFISPSGNTGYAPNIDFGLLGANGLVFNNEGDIMVCQHGDRRIASIDNTASSSPNFVTVVDNFEGKKFNSPNDLVFANDGSFYFTDPSFGFFNLETFQFVVKNQQII